MLSRRALLQVSSFLSPRLSGTRPDHLTQVLQITQAALSTTDCRESARTDISASTWNETQNSVCSRSSSVLLQPQHKIVGEEKIEKSLVSRPRNIQHNRNSNIIYFFVQQEKSSCKRRTTEDRGLRPTPSGRKHFENVFEDKVF